MMVTAREITREFREHGTITIPKGVRVTDRCADGSRLGGEFFIDELDWIPEVAPGVPNHLLRHDAYHYGIRVRSGDVTEA